MRLSWSAPERLRILDFDCEARPLSFGGGDFVFKEITAIAAKFIGEPGPVHCWLLGEVDTTEMLEGFRELYDQADMVTGHNIRRYDLPILNGAFLELGLQRLGGKLTQDTYADLTNRHGVSVSQESLAGMLGVSAPKVQMSQPRWREANRLTPDGIELTRRRVVGDVRQHILLRRRLLELGYLRAPRLWSSGGGLRVAA